MVIIHNVGVAPYTVGVCLVNVCQLNSVTPASYRKWKWVAVLVDPDEPNTIRLLLKPAMLAKVVHMWRSKANRGEEMLLYWKEDEEDVDDDEPYYQESDDEDS